ncbi:MAG: hypothetical protein ACOYKE_02595 [Ferruginibacter sp.]
MKKFLLFFLSLVLALSTLIAQSRIEYTPVKISIDIPDVVINETTIKRKAELFTMTYNQSSKYLSLNWKVTHYADSLGQYGQSLDKLIPSWTKESIADNATAVNPQTGQILVPDSLGNYSINYLGQYDFFNMLAENSPIQVHNLIRQYGLSVESWDKK